MPLEEPLKLRQVSQPTANLDRAIGFYRDVLGASLVAQFGNLAFFDLGGTRLLVEGSEQATTSRSVLYFAVDDISVAREELEGRGVNFLDEPHAIHRDDDGLFGPAGHEEWMTFFRDPDGNLLALSSQVASD